MKLVFDREDLSRALSVVERVLPKRSALPFYQALYVGRVSDDLVELRVTNGDQFLQMMVPAQVSDGEGVALPGEEFLRLVRVAPGQTVEITADDVSARVVSGGAEWRLRYLVGVSWADAPPPIEEAVAASTEANPAALLESLRKVQYAVSRTQNRPSFQQVLVGSRGVVASDGRRAHVVWDKWGGDFLFPSTVLEVVIDLLDALPEDEDMTMEIGETGWVRLRSDDAVFTTGMLAYPFPDVLDAMVATGQSQEARVKLNRHELVAAVRVAASAEDEGSVLLSVENGVLRVESESTVMRASMELKVEADGLQGKWARWFTSELLTELLGAFESEQLEFRVAPSGQGVLYVEDGAECSVLMPLVR